MDEIDLIYIYSPSWVEWSAGIRVLHYLCDLLNQNGYNAFLVLHGLETEPETSPSLITPVLTKALFNKHTREARRIVALYPEGIKGNPLNAEYVIRWVLNFPSLLGGLTTFDDETVLTYSKALSDALGDESRARVLFIPALKSCDFEAPFNHGKKSEGFGGRPYELIYAQKFQALGGKLSRLGINQFEITRFGRNAPSRKQTLELIYNSNLVHVYENTTVITEALLFGVSVLCHRNQFFDSLIAENELPMVGISWDESRLVAADRGHNLKVLKDAENKASSNLIEVFSNIELIPKKRYASSAKLRYPKRGVITKHSLDRAVIVLKQKGLKVFVRFFFNYIFRDKRPETEKRNVNED